MAELKEERPLGELVGRITQDMTHLVRQEIQLARTEVGDTVSRAGRRIGVLAAGALVGYVGMLALVATIILLLDEVVGLPAWAAALIVGAVLAITGYVMARRGIDALRHLNPTPRRTVETIKDDIQWVKEQRS